MADCLLVRHRVRNYREWRRVFDEVAPDKKSTGLKNGMVSCNSSDPNEVFVYFEIADESKAREFMNSPQLRQDMQRGGVVGEPDVWFMDTKEKVKPARPHQMTHTPV